MWMRRTGAQPHCLSGKFPLSLPWDFVRGFGAAQQCLCVTEKANFGGDSSSPGPQPWSCPPPAAPGRTETLSPPARGEFPFGHCFICVSPSSSSSQGSTRPRAKLKNVPKPQPPAFRAATPPRNPPHLALGAKKGTRVEPGDCNPSWAPPGRCRLQPLLPCSTEEDGFLQQQGGKKKGGKKNPTEPGP